jgi:nucleotide sugar dehydrogenase
MSKPLIGFIGQGFIGMNYANDFEARGHTIVRFAKESPYNQNKDAIASCDIVFIAVPTPTTPAGYDSSIIEAVIPLARSGAIVVLKSTILPGLTKVLQEKFPDRIIIHSPEFLSEATAAFDSANPFMNIVGITKQDDEHKKAAELVMSVLPPSPFNKIVTSEEAELIKYTHNCSGYTQIIFFNLMYDLAGKLGADWKNIEEAMRADPYVPNRYSSPVHKSGRGAGGHCFIKDMAALGNVYEKVVGDSAGVNVIKSMEEKNKSLLKQTNKDQDLLQGVYGN